MVDLEELEAMHRYEMDCNVDDEYSRWLGCAQRILGHDLDGTQWVDGFSLDHAYDCFFCRMPLLEYIALVKANPLYTGGFNSE